MSAFSLFFENGCNFNIKTLKPSLTEQGFFSFFFSMVTVLDLNKIMNFLKLGEYLYLKEENFDSSVSWKKILIIFYFFST